MSGPAREGLALLQGLLRCSKCGRRISVRYKGNGGIYPTYDCNALRREGLSTTSCMSIRCDLVDTAVTNRVLEILQPAQIELAASAIRQLENRDQTISRQWQMRIERAEYEAQLAERRYEEVDPSNRLVAATLEKRWNDALSRLEELREEHADVQKSQGLAVTEEQRARVRALAEDFPRLWNAPSTRARDKKRILRMLIDDVTVERAEPKIVILHLRWQGGACEDIHVHLPPSAADQVRYSEQIVQRVRELARELPDNEIAQTLNTEGHRPSKSEEFNASIVRWIRYGHQIPAPDLKRPEEMTVKEVAAKFGVSRGVVYYWIERGVIEARRRNNGSPYWITLNAEIQEQLRAWVHNSSRIHNANNKPEVVL